MKCKICIITLIYFLFCENYMVCHLKDMGEYTWRSSLKDLEAIKGRIFGGTPVSLEKYPFNVQLYNMGALCSGSILTRQTVLTAAHCFDNNKNLAEMLIFSQPRVVFDVTATVHGVWDVKTHEEYNQNLFSSDIAIIIVYKPFVFSPFVQKAMLVTTLAWMKPGEKFIATGWGANESGKTIRNNTLREVELEYVPAMECMRVNRIEVTSDMFCLYGSGKRDTCRGDSGGGILWKGAIVGLTSHGRGCGLLPGMYTNVYHFMSWINSTVVSLMKKYCDFYSG